MADTNITAKLTGGGVQNSGNPVFDATVNLIMSAGFVPKPETIHGLHAALLEIYAKEPISHSRIQEEAK